MTSFFTGTELFNTNNISIRELNKFNYLKDPLNLRFDQSNVKLNPKNTNNNDFFNDYIIKKLVPIPNSNSKQRIAPSNYYLDLIDISHESNKHHNKQDYRESLLLNDKDLNGTLGSIKLDKIVLENTMAVEKNIVNISESEYIARKMQADENANNFDSIMTLDVLNSQLELNYQKRLDIALQKVPHIPIKTNKSSSSESNEEDFIQTENVQNELIEDEKIRYKQMKKNRKLSLDEELSNLKQREEEINNEISSKSSKKGKTIKEKTDTLDTLNNSMPFSTRNDINNIINQLKETEDHSFINNIRDILFSTNQKNVSLIERNDINKIYTDNNLPPIKNAIKVKFSIIRNLKSNIKSKMNIIENDDDSDEVYSSKK